MSPPARRTSAVLAVLLSALLLAGCADRSSPSPAGSSPGAPDSANPSASPTLELIEPETGSYGVALPEPVPAGSFTLTDQRGQPFRFPRDLDGRVVLLYFGYTHCPDICPGTLAGIAVALRGLRPAVRDAVDVVFVTVDPARDTVEVLGDYVGLFNEDFVGLTGTEDEVVGALATYGFAPPERLDLGGGEYSVGHPAGVLAFTDDRLAHLEYPFGVTADMWEHDLRKLVEDGWEEP